MASGHGNCGAAVETAHIKTGMNWPDGHDLLSPEVAEFARGAELRECYSSSICRAGSDTLGTSIREPSAYLNLTERDAMFSNTFSQQEPYG
jgi:hypothetical protein